MAEQRMRYIAQRQAGENGTEAQGAKGNAPQGREEEIWVKKEYLLFDLDGTLTDPKVGITSCVQYALKEFGIEEPDLDKLEPFIGPPLKDSFQMFYGFDDAQADRAVAKYRERFQDQGIFENELYDGIVPMLKKLKLRGMHLGVASSKPTVFVERILEHFKMREYFEVVVGSELDGTRSEKAEVVSEALRRFFPDGAVQKHKIFMIGDRKFDAQGARAVGVESVGVTYGYGSMEELMEAHADYIVRSVEELRRFLLRGYEDMEKDLTQFQKMWVLIYHIVLFVVIRGLVQSLGADLLRAGGAETISEETGTLLFALGSLAGGAALFASARRTIKRTIRDMYLTHLKWEPKSAYGLLAVAGFGLSIGGGMLLGLTGLAEKETVWTVLSQKYAGTPLLLAFAAYGIVGPVAEELLFRGVIYGYVRRFFDIKTAVVGSAILFGVFQGNLAPAVYWVTMGYLIAYAYEYFGEFWVPMLLRVEICALLLVMDYTGLGKTAFVCWPVCIALLLLGGTALFGVARRKKIL